MNQVERLYKIEQLLGEAHTVPIAAMLERLEISRATFKRDLATLRDRLNAPIVWDRFGGGYRFEPQRRNGAKRAVLTRRQVQIHYYSRGSGETTDRLISPQRLVNTERALGAYRVGR